MCVMMVVRELMNLAPWLGLPLTCEPSVYMKSCRFHFRFWGLEYAMSSVSSGQKGVGVSWQV